MLIPRPACLLGALALLALTASAQTAAAPPQAPGSRLSGIEQLGAGEWLDLGVPAPDPVHGLATGREYTPRMAYAPDLGGAFLTGEGQHGFVNPATNRYVDDVWFYDLVRHRWVCVKPGSEVTTLDLTLNQDDFEIDARGRLLPVAQLGHGYEFVTYDAGARKFFMQPLPNTYWVAAMPQRLNWLPDANFPLTQIDSPWLFDAATGRWERRPPGTPAPTYPNQSARAIAVQYVPSQGKVWMWETSSTNRRRVWWFDTLQYAWSETATVNDGPIVSGHGTTCFVPGLDRVYYYGVDAATQAARLWHYDVQQRTWVDTNSGGVPSAAVVYVTADTGMTHDEAARSILLKKERGGSYPVFWEYDVRANTWSAQPIEPPAALQPLFKWRHVNAFYAREQNAHFLHVAGSGAATGQILVYRHGEAPDFTPPR